MWFIGVEVEQETSAPPPKKNPGPAPEPPLKLKMNGPLLPLHIAFLINVTSARVLTEGLKIEQ